MKHPGSSSFLRQALSDFNATISGTSGSSRHFATRKQNLKVAVLNMASAYKPGGGVRNGAGAQAILRWQLMCWFSLSRFLMIFSHFFFKNAFFNFQSCTAQETSAVQLTPHKLQVHPRQIQISAKFCYYLCGGFNHFSFPLIGGDCPM